MIKDNRIIFGYGTILLDASSIRRTVKMKYIQPPKEIGVDLSNQDLSDVVVMDEVEFEYNKDMRELYESLDGVNENHPIVEFRGYQLDFSNFNEKSLLSVKQSFKIAINGFQLGYAC